jgi:hypothetical protein
MLFSYLLVLVICSTLFINVSCVIPKITNWINQFGTGANEAIFRHALDGSGSGSIYVSGYVEPTGYTQGSLVGTNNNIQANNMGGYDWMTLKYNSAGVIQWMRVLQSTNHDFGVFVASDTSGNVYSGGGTQGYLSTILGIITPFSVGVWDCVIVSYDPIGNMRWITRDLARNGVQDYVVGMVTKDNFIWVLQYTSSPFSRIISKLNCDNGGIIWQQTWTASGADIGNGQLIIDSNNLLMWVGWTTGAVGPTVDSAGNTIQGWVNQGGNDAFIAVYDGVSGNKLANLPLQTPGDDYATGIAVDGTGLVYVSGFSNVAFRGAAYTAPGHNGFLTAYLLPSLQVQWTKGLNRRGFGYQLTTDGLGGIYQIEWRTPGDQCFENCVCFATNNFQYALNKWDINGNLLSTEAVQGGCVQTHTVDSSGVYIQAGVFNYPFDGINSVSYNQGYTDGFIKKSTIDFNCTCNDLNTLVTQVGTLLNLQTDFTYN